MNRSSQDFVLQSQQTLRSEREHTIDSLQILIFTLLMILVVLTNWLFKHKKINYIHETGLALIYGKLIQGVLKKSDDFKLG